MGHSVIMKNNQDLLESTLFYYGKIGSIQNHAFVQNRCVLSAKISLALFSLCVIFLKRWENFIDSITIYTYNCLFLLS